MSSTISHVTPNQYQPPTNVQRTGKDADGDNDASKSGEIEKKPTPAPKPTATVGNNVNTFA